MKGEKVNIILGKLCADISEGKNISSGQTFTCTSNIARIGAYDSSRIKSNKFGEDTVGIFIPGGTVEYFRVEVGDIITVLEGEINISCPN